LTPETAGGSYIHGTHPEEQRRLSLLNEILNAGSLRELDLRGGERILDLGSGLGQFTRAMARAAGPSGAVIGIERSSDQIRQALELARDEGEETIAGFRQGEASAPPLSDVEWGSFDIVHTRFLLEHVTNPGAIVEAMVRAAKPGGRIVLEDDDHDVLRLHPEPPGFAPLWQAYIRAYDRLGNDGLIGRRLVTLLHRAGAKPVRSTWIYFGACAGESRFLSFADNMIGVIVGARDHILQEDLLDAAPFDDAIESLHHWKLRPDAVLWYAVCWAVGQTSVCHQ
jgi:SAM-dependent methyltransferase